MFEDCILLVAFIYRTSLSLSLAQCFMLLTSTFGTTSRSDIFVLSSIRLFQSSTSMVLSRQRVEMFCKVSENILIALAKFLFFS